MRSKWLVSRMMHGIVCKVWFIVLPGRDRVLIDWVFTGKRHTVPVTDARHIWRGLYIMGFRGHNKKRQKRFMNQ